MTIIEDTRQKAGKHANKHRVWKQNGDNIVRCMLPCADYALPPERAVDTKQDLTEIAGNLLGSYKERKRVLNEIESARDMGTKLIFLIEQDSIKSKDDLMEIEIKLANGRTVSGTDLLQKMEQIRALYGCEFIFCPPSKAAETINKILLKDERRNP